ncbi:MAG: hypothetical protein LBI01_01335 [Elusimicrobium sp.]|jgi:hypothetical protein|nr:hypothetical protein [Elusimicrobium sp.]
MKDFFSGFLGALFSILVYFVLPIVVVVYCISKTQLPPFICFGGTAILSGLLIQLSVIFFDMPICLPTRYLLWRQHIFYGKDALQISLLFIIIGIVLIIADLTELVPTA